MSFETLNSSFCRKARDNRLEFDHDLITSERFCKWLGERAVRWVSVDGVGDVFYLTSINSSLMSMLRILLSTSELMECIE